MSKMVPVPSKSIVPQRDVDKPPVLDVRNLGIDFGGLRAVDDFTFTMGRTEIGGLIGPNGAGKTTIFNLLTNVYRPTRGAILLNGTDTLGKSTYQVSKMGIARTFQNIRLFDDMSVLDNVKVGLHNHIHSPLVTSLTHLFGYGKAERKASARWSCSQSLACRIWRRRRPAACPMARSGAWRSCAHLRPSPASCCWTSLQPV